MASPIASALAMRWIHDGGAQAMLEPVRDESIARQALATRRLARHGRLALPEGFHLGLPVASSWSVVEFASYLRTQGVAVVPSAAFYTAATRPTWCACASAGGCREQCDAALALIADTLDHPRHPHAAVM